MKKLLLALLACAPIFAQSPCPAGFVQITGALNNPDGTGFNGKVQPFLAYSTAAATENRMSVAVSAGTMRAPSNNGNVCLAPGNYTVTYSATGTNLSYTRYWTVTAPGPETLASVESATPSPLQLQILWSQLPTPPATGTYCVEAIAGVIDWVACAVGGDSLTWGQLTSLQWAMLTSSQWSTLTGSGSSGALSWGSLTSSQWSSLASSQWSGLTL